MAHGLDSLEDHPRQVTPDRTCVVFDGDDTLWITEPLYDEARSRARSIVEANGLDGSQWEILERRIDIENVKLLGYSPGRFPRSCRQAYEVYQSAHGGAVDPDLASQLECAASAVFERSAQLMPGANETLRALKERGARLGLLTKGDLAVQRKRIADSLLASLFDAISIVPYKSASDVQRLMEQLDSVGRLTWVVGNSLNSDIIPALAAGANAIWIDAHVWEHERVYDAAIDGRVIHAHSLHDILQIITS